MASVATYPVVPAYWNFLVKHYNSWGRETVFDFLLIKHPKGYQYNFTRIITL